MKRRYKRMGPPEPKERVCKNCACWQWVIAGRTGFCRIIIQHDGYTTKRDFPSTPDKKACEKYQERIAIMSPLGIIPKIYETSKDTKKKA